MSIKTETARYLAQADQEREANDSMMVPFPVVRALFLWAYCSRSQGGYLGGGSTLKQAETVLMEAVESWVNKNRWSTVRVGATITENEMRNLTGHLIEHALTLTEVRDVINDHDRLVRELDRELNGASAAPQASLCDLVSQVRRIRSITGKSREDYARLLTDRSVDTTIGLDDAQRPTFINTATEISYRGWLAGIEHVTMIKPEPLAYQWRGRFDNGNWTAWTTCNKSQADWIAQTSEEVEVRKLGEIRE